MIQVLDFFSGCGGVSAGFSAAGMKPVFALDLDRDALDSFALNHPRALVRHQPIEAVDHAELARLRAQGVSVFVGCCPCQQFSQLNLTGRTEKRTLVGVFVDTVLRHLPDVVFMENVREAARSPEYARAVGELGAAGYRVHARVFGFADFGLPQERRRLVVVATRHAAPFLWPGQTHAKHPDLIHRPWNTVRGAIGDLPPIPAGAASPDDPLHAARAVDAVNLARLRATPEGGNWRDWPKHLRIPSQNRTVEKGVRGFETSYGRLWWDRPAPTMVTQCNGLSHGRHAHPGQDRAITVREAARFQGFPDSYQFAGSLTSIARQVGNAVPLMVAALFGSAIVRHLHQSSRFRSNHVHSSPLNHD